MYVRGRLVGWDEKIGMEAFQMFCEKAPAFRIQGQTRSYAGRKMMLFNICRKVLGQDTKNYPQQIGDCVSFGAKNAIEYGTCTSILLGHAHLKFRPIFPPYLYGSGRVLIGGQHSMEDGSSGTWMAEAVKRYGAIFADDEGVPQYSGQVAKQWGYSGPPDKFVQVGRTHLVKTVSPIQSWDNLVDAIVNGYACPVASNVGYQMGPGPDGFHNRSGQWGHQMCFIGVGFQPEEYAIILNNWGDVHGHLKDFDTNDPLPVGVLRVRKRDALAHIQAGETFAYSQFDGFPEQKLDEALFKIIGN